MPSIEISGFSIAAPPAEPVLAPPAELVLAPPAELVLAPPAELVLAPAAELDLAPPAEIVLAPPGLAPSLVRGSIGQEDKTSFARADTELAAVFRELAFGIVALLLTLPGVRALFLSVPDEDTLLSFSFL